MNQLVSIGTAFMFLTRLPVGQLCSADPLELAISTRYFPLVGFVVGTLLALCLWCVQLILPDSVAVILMLVLAVCLTGALHEDGLADVVDSFGAFGLDNKLSIMRDSRVGTYGALALILLVLLKFVTVWELAQINVSSCLLAVVSAHVLSRWSSVWLMARANYIRAVTANKNIADNVNNARLIESTLCVLVVFLPLAWLVSPLVYLLLLLAWLVSVACVHRFNRLFGGITGDCIGAANQLVELSVYIAVLAAVMPI